MKRILCILLLALLLSGCVGEAALPTAPTLIEPVQVKPLLTKAYIGDIYKTSQFSVCTAPYTEELYMETGGRVEAIYAYPGKEVKKGEVLLKLDQSTLLSRIASMEESIAREKQNNEYDNAIAELDIEILKKERQQLVAQGADKTALALKDNDIARQEAALRQAKAQQALDLEVQETELSRTRAELGRNTLVAPFDGVIADWNRQLAVGNSISAYDTLFLLADMSRIFVNSESNLPQSYFDNADRVYLVLGDGEYGIRTMDEASVEALPAGMKELGYYYEALDENGEPVTLEAGLIGFLYVIRDYTPDVLLIPNSTITREGGKDYVYVDQDGRKVRKEIKTGLWSNGAAHVLEGLEEGDLIYV